MVRFSELPSILSQKSFRPLYLWVQPLLVSPTVSVQFQKKKKSTSTQFSLNLNPSESLISSEYATGTRAVEPVVEIPYTSAYFFFLLSRKYTTYIY